MLKEIVTVITRDPMKKIFAIIFAFGLWIYVAIGNNYTYHKNIKVTYMNLADSLMIVDSIPSINVNFTGRGGALFSIWAAPPRAQCDLRQATPGDETITARDLRIPVGYGPLRIDYIKQAFNVTIDRKIEKELEINVPLRDTPKKGYAIHGVTVLDTVHVVGPLKMLAKMEELVTETLSVRNRSNSFEKELRLEIPYALLNVSRKSVRVRIDLDSTAQKVLTAVPLKLIYSPSQRVRSDRSILDTLIVVGSPDRISKLSMDDVEVRIRLTKMTTGEYDLPAEVGLPDYAKPPYSAPQKFHVTIY
jgi:YbbR domain-containing protein